MKTHVPLPLASKGWLAWASLALAGCLLSQGRAQAAEETERRPSTEPADRDECRLRLSRIHEAILEYQKEHKALPRWLSELVPDYLNNPEVLICPYVQKSGETKRWRDALVVIPVFADPVLCTYGYEFCLQPIPELRTVTCRAYKQRQMALAGFGVPIVRCLAHTPHLNLAFDGSLYESELFWEDNFVRAPVDETVLHDIMLTLGYNDGRPVQRMVRARDPAADLRLLDLTDHYTATLLLLSQLDLAGNLLQTFPEGLTSVDGVKFDTRGLVHLAGRDFPIPFPERLDKIAVGQKCARVHFLHGASFSSAPGTQIARYVVHYQDGGTKEIPVVYGRDVRTHWIESARDDTREEPKPAWISPASLAGPRGRLLRLYHTAWNNPNPDLEISRIGFVSHLTASAPFLVAVTLE